MIRMLGSLSEGQVVAGRSSPGHTPNTLNTHSFGKGMQWDI